MPTVQADEAMKAALNLSKQTDRLLWDSYCQGDPLCDTIGSRMRFPRNFADNDRISEQEARFLFCHVIERKTTPVFYYSVEVPTKLGYGSGVRSAMTDVAVYFDEDRFPDLNVEFKAGGITPTSENIDDRITKDMLKLIREDVHGLWFHVLKSAGPAALRNTLETLRVGFERAEKNIRRNHLKGITEKSILFHICCLDIGYSLSKTLSISPDDETFLPDGFFGLSSDGSAPAKDVFLKATSMNRWSFYRR